MDGLKWFEKRWFVNLKIKTRLKICFLAVAVIAAAIGVASILFVISNRVPHREIFAAVIGLISILEIAFAWLLAGINGFLVVDPTVKNEKIISTLATGDLQAKKFIRERDRITKDFQDEIGSLTRNLSKLIHYMREIEACIYKVSEGDLKVEVPIRSPDDQIGNAFDKLVKNFHDLVASMVKVIEKVTAGADLVSSSSQTLSQGATEQASAIQQLTASLEHIATQTRLNAENAEEASKLTKKTRENALRGNEHMKEMLHAMDEITIASKNINNIIKVIEDIAFQTNILALNAAVEAARAGQHGKGFAVVADEVKNLAGKSADAAKEITELIENSIAKVQAGSKIANETAQSLNEIVEEIDRAASLIQSIAEASMEQANGIEQVNIGISQVSEVVQNNAAVAEESAAASQELSAHASELMQKAAIFKL